MSEPGTPEAMEASPVKAAGGGGEDDAEVVDVAAAILGDDEEEDAEANADNDKKKKKKKGKAGGDDLDAFMDSKLSNDDEDEVKAEDGEDEEEGDEDGDKKPAADEKSKKKAGRPKKSEGGGGATIDKTDMVFEGPPDDNLGDGIEWPEGWMKRKFKRASGATANRVDNYWYSPEGRRFRSKPQVIQFLQDNGDIKKKRGRPSSPVKSPKKKAKTTSAARSPSPKKTKKQAARKSISKAKASSSSAKAAKASSSTVDGEMKEKFISGFMLFSSEHRQQVKDENPNLPFGQIGKKLGEMWHALSEVEKNKYKKRKVVTGMVSVKKKAKKTTAAAKTPAQLAVAAANAAVAKISAERSDPEYEGIPTDPLPDGMEWTDGWMTRTFIRASGNTAGSKDRYWYSPGNKKFRSVMEVKKFMKALIEHDGDEAIAFKNFRKIELTEEEKAVGKKKTSGSTTKPSKKKKTDDDDAEAVVVEAVAVETEEEEENGDGGEEEGKEEEEEEEEEEEAADTAENEEAV